MAGARDLSLPEELRGGVLDHLGQLKRSMRSRGWGNEMGFGERPAIIVIDLAGGWVEAGQLLGSDLEGVVHSTVRLLEAARKAGVPRFFTVTAYDDGDPHAPWETKRVKSREALAIGTRAADLDPRLDRRPEEKLIVKKYQSCFKGTDLHDMLAGLQIDTLIVTGCSTSRCVESTCVDAIGGYRVVVPREAVGDRCELFHLVALLDLEMILADVMPTDTVVRYLEEMQRK